MVAPGGEKIPRFRFYMAPINQARLHVNDRTLDLAERIEPGDVVTLSSARFPWLLMRLKHPEGRP